MVNDIEIQNRINKITQCIREILKEGGLKGSAEYEKLYNERAVLESLLRGD